MDEARKKELAAYGITSFILTSGSKGRNSSVFFGTHQSLLDKYMYGKRKRCACCQKMTYNWQGSQGYYVCYDGCFSTTGYDERTPDGWPQWIERKKKRTRKPKKDDDKETQGCS